MPHHEHEVEVFDARTSEPSGRSDAGRIAPVPSKSGASRSCDRTKTGRTVRAQLREGSKGDARYLQRVQCSWVAFHELKARDCGYVPRESACRPDGVGSYRCDRLTEPEVPRPPRWTGEFEYRGGTGVARLVEFADHLSHDERGRARRGPCDYPALD